MSSTRGKRTRASAVSGASATHQTVAGPRGGAYHQSTNANGAAPKAAPAKRRRTTGGEPSVVDLGKLDIGTLRKYQRHYGVRTKSNKTNDKEELARAVSKHFAELVVDEEETIESFVSTLMRTTH